MNDVFLSYAHEDLPRIRPLVEALEQRGWSVFWDRVIPPGKTFDSLIEEALEASKCVVVIWSKNSVESRWVRTEAEEGRSRNILIPVLIEDVRLPLAFRMIQAVDLRSWSGDPGAREIAALYGAIAQLTAPSHTATPEEILNKGEIFVSYSREDISYARELIEYLRRERVTVWADDRIDFGDRWWRTIVKHLRNCVGMVVIMTPASEESKWVEREVLFADEEGKPIFPLLLQGEEISLVREYAIP